MGATDTTLAADPTARWQAPSSVEPLVVPLDGSALSRAALEVAAPLARRLGAAVELVSIVAHTADVDARRAELAAVDLPADRTGAVRRTVLVGADPAAALLRALADRPAAVACMSSHGRGHSAALVGSVTRAVVARAQRPLVVASPLVDASVGQGVLACVDGGPSSAGLVALAVGWADILGDSATLVAFTAGPGSPARWPRPWFASPDVARVELEALALPAREAGARVEVRLLRDPVGPAGGVCRHLRRRPARLVVIGARSHVGLPRLALGSEAGSIVRHSPSPVLVVPGVVAP